jgi:CheY-like chemotaxis protein
VSTDPTRAAVHELRNLLTAILGFSDLIERRRRDDEWLVKTAGRIRDAAVRAREATARIGSPATSDDASGEPCVGCPRVLVLESDPVVRTLVREVLEISSFEVHDVADACTAVKRLRAGVPRYDVLVLDWSLPPEGSREVLDALGEASPAPVVIGISGMDDPPDLSVESRVPVSTWLHKPFHNEELVGAVRAALARRD